MLIRRHPALVFVLLLALAAAVATVFAARTPAATVFAADVYEPDNSATQSKVLPVDSVHSFSANGDADWARITATAGQRFSIETLPLDGDALNTKVTVYLRNPDGSTTPVDGNDDHPVFPDTLASGLIFTAPSAGTYYVVVTPSASGAVGKYRLSIAKGVARRVYGANRYSTAAEVSRLAWSNAGLASWGTTNGPDTIVVAGGTDVNSALAGSVLAAVNDSVLLLTPSTGLATETKNEIRRLSRVRALSGGKVKVYIVGTTTAVSSAAESSIRAIPEVGSVVRLAGVDAHATAARVASEMKATSGISNTAFVVSRTAWADAIGAAPVASTAGAPILFTEALTLPIATQSAIQSLGIKKVVIVGGTGSVSSGVENALRSLTGSTPVRLGGANRYSTARLAAQYGVDVYGMDGRSVIVASGEVFPDALSAGPLTWWTGSPVLLTPKASLSPEVVSFVNSNGPRVLPSYVVGGPGSVSDAALAALAGRY